MMQTSSFEHCSSVESTHALKPQPNLEVERKTKKKIVKHHLLFARFPIVSSILTMFRNNFLPIESL